MILIVKTSSLFKRPEVGDTLKTAEYGKGCQPAIFSPLAVLREMASRPL